MSFVMRLCVCVEEGSFMHALPRIKAVPRVSFVYSFGKIGNNIRRILGNL